LRQVGDDPAEVDLAASALDPDGRVTKVEFYRNKMLIATVAAAASASTPGAYRHTDRNVPPGAYTYSAKAYDDGTPTAIAIAAAPPIAIARTSERPPESASRSSDVAAALPAAASQGASAMGADAGPGTAAQVPQPNECGAESLLARDDACRDDWIERLSRPFGSPEE
jgi:hypothetical protein